MISGGISILSKLSKSFGISSNIQTLKSKLNPPHIYRSTSPSILVSIPQLKFFPFELIFTSQFSPKYQVVLQTRKTMSTGSIATETMQFHVLAVDDSLIDRKLIERLLKTSSYQVTAVDSGVKALEYLGLLDDDNVNNTDSNSVSTTKNHHEVEVNLIITDYCMPGITGYDLLRKIKESRSLKDIPVVIMSSENVPSRINSCLEQGAEEFFLKPVRQSDLNKLRPHLMRGKGKENQPNIVNKRKPMEECLSPDRTRTRYIDLDL